MAARYLTLGSHSAHSSSCSQLVRERVGDISDVNTGSAASSQKVCRDQLFSTPGGLCSENPGMARADASLAGLCCDVFDRIATQPLRRPRPHFTRDQTASLDEPDDSGLPSYARIEVLVAYLTSRDVVRSDAMREFFMTFRMFASPLQVWDLLCARLLWAAHHAARNGGESEVGNDIGTRGFVLLRYWISEYFDVDFAKDLALRAHAAAILNALSGQTEVVLSAHFRRIHAQLRRAWIAEVARRWPVPADIAGNDDAPAPAGGRFDPAHSAPADPGLLRGRVLIDADIGVPMIRSSPQRARPKPKMSMLFRRRTATEHKPNEAVLHNKVDLLALRVINQYHGLVERQAKHRHQEHQQNHPEVPNHAEVRRDAEQDARDTEGETVEVETEAQEAQPSLEHDLAAPVRPGLQRGSHSSVPSMLVPDISDSAIIGQARVQTINRLLPPFTGQILPGGPDPAPLVVPATPTELTSAQITALESAVPTFTPPQAPNPGAHSERPHTERSQTERPPSGPNAESSPRSLRSPHSPHSPQSPRSPLNGHSFLSSPGKGLTPISPAGSPRTSTYNVPRSPYSVHAIASELHTPRHLSSHGSFHSTSTTSSSEFRTPTPSFPDDEEWTTPLDSPSSTEDGIDAEMHHMPHEKSMDTLDMEHMGLATTSDDEDGPVAEPMNWGPIDMDNLERVSYSGSSLSTLSITRESTFSYHGDQASVLPEPRDMSWSRTRESLVARASPHPSQHSTLPESFVDPATGRPIEHRTDHNMDYSHGNDINTNAGEAAAEVAAEGESDIDAEYGYDDVPGDEEHLDGDNDSDIDMSHTFSLLSEQDNSMLQPCAGYTSRDADQLKAMPDQCVQGDVLGATLQMLEGTYADDLAAEGINLTQHPPPAGDDSLDMGYARGIPRSNTAELYAQAFSSSKSVADLANDVGELGIPAPHGVDAILAHVRDPAPAAPELPQGISPTVPLNRHMQLSTSKPSAVGPMLSQPSLHIGAPGASHAPFVLSYTARTLAEQMTLIERDLLKQLDWQELIEVRWPSTDFSTVSWIGVLERSPPVRGVELVTARFELVCAWVRSELLLCESPALLAQAFSRFVHISFEALRLQNFTTMIQIVLGLTSESVRIHMGEATLKLISENDRDTLERLSSLASPLRNFAAIRETHRRLSRTRACIPFTPIILADLAANATASASNAEDEIHFEKYRTAAKLVQTLQQGIKHSQSYEIEPQQAVLSKCLYLSALTKEEELQLINV